jgi:hypothetical protein
VEGVEAVPTCAAALSVIPEQLDLPQDKVWQLNRCIVEAPIIEDQILTQAGDKLYVRVTLHDWTGSAVVHVLDKAAPQLYGCRTKEEVLDKARDGTLLAMGHRFNLRGVIRTEGGSIKKYVVDICKSPLPFKTSSAAMRGTRGLAEISTGVAQAAPVDRIQCDPMQGLSLKSGNADGEPDLLPAFRILILVTGTQPSDLDPLHSDEKDMKKQAYCVTSKNAEMLVGHGQGHAHRLDVLLRLLVKC